jgi:Adaptor complexes medium subunit family
MFTASGLIVRFLKVFEKSNYHSIKWVRYLTKASGTYQIRVSFLLTSNITWLPILIDFGWPAVLIIVE